MDVEVLSAERLCFTDGAPVRAASAVVPFGDGHVVVWPNGDPDLRRHWHRHCWRLEVRRETGAAEW